MAVLCTIIATGMQRGPRTSAMMLVSRDAETSTDGISGTFMQRTALLFRIAAYLKRLAHDHNLVVLLVNQASA